MIEKATRLFVNQNIRINDWSDIETYYNTLLNTELDSVENVEKWLIDRSELESILEEELAWRYIKMNCNTTDLKLSNHFEKFITKIEPQINKYSNELDEKFLKSSVLDTLDSDKYEILIRNLKKKTEIFREENIPIFAELQTQEQEYGKICAAQTIHYNDEEITLQKAANYLKNINREIRKEVYELINERRMKDSDTLNQLFSELIQKRRKIAVNAGFDSFRDYKFADLLRFDYSVEDCFDFHESVRKHAVPIIEKLYKRRTEKLNLMSLRPFDTEVDENLKPPLKPFTGSQDMIQKTIECFRRIKPQYGNFIEIMNQHNYLDLESRKGKAPGGFNYPLFETNIPFIFMNSTGSQSDLRTIVHEGGHAIHSFLSKHIKLVNYKSLPSEIAELASMSMELISMEYWDTFYTNPEDLKRAKKSQLESVISILPWIALVDKFQHWIYLNPQHSIEQRNMYWKNIAQEFQTKAIDWTGYESFFVNAWQKQLHIFEVPFYYIEYGMAQLGAISIWKNFKTNKAAALTCYENALKLGGSVSIKKVYHTAGIKFDFSSEYIGGLLKFVEDELNAL